VADDPDHPGIVVRLVEGVTATALVLMVLLVCGLVGLRELRVERLVPGVGELQERILARYTYVSQLLPAMLSWLTFLGAVLADRRGEHLGNDVLVDRLPERPRQTVRRVGRFVWVAFFAVVAVLGLGQVAEGESLGELRSIGLPAWVLQIGLPLGAGLLAVVAARSLLADLRGRPGRPRTPDRGGPV
jgi:TRAP-type C4-dicarboxylate transport system permease small subunit